MGKAVVPASRALGQFLREQRIARGWSLREVEERCRSYGRPIPFTTLAKVERGRIDPGVRRLAALFKVYDLPLSLAQDVIDLEEMADVPRRRVADRGETVERWQAGDLREALAELAELRSWTPNDEEGRAERQEQLLTLSIFLSGLGKNRLARLVVDELLCEPPLEPLRIRILAQAAVCWKRLGSGDAALGLIDRAAALLPPGEQAQRARILHQRAAILEALGQIADASRTLEDAIALYRSVGEDYGEDLALGLRVRVFRTLGHLVETYEAAREARAHADRHGFKRLAAIRAIDEGRALVDLARVEDGIHELRVGLAHAIETHDRMAEFYGHYCLWKAYRTAGDVGRAQVELKAAQYFVQFVDFAVPETNEVRALGATPRRGASRVRRRPPTRRPRRVDTPGNPL
jgi:transcriptional regulator with XRE-family HTH domain